MKSTAKDNNSVSLCLCVLAFQKKIIGVGPTDLIPINIDNYNSPYGLPYYLSLLQSSFAQ